MQFVKIFQYYLVFLRKLTQKKITMKTNSIIKQIFTLLTLMLFINNCEPVNKAPDDASLEKISVNNKNIEGFHSDTLTYYIQVANESGLPEINATATNSNATVGITGPDNIPAAATIVVTAENGTTKRTYTLYLTNSLLPPQSSFVMELSDFVPSPQKSISVDTNASNNWGFAAFQVGVWNTFIGLGMLVPKAS